MLLDSVIWIVSAMVSMPLLRYRLSFNHGYRHYKRGGPAVAVLAIKNAMRQGRRVSAKAVAYLVLAALRGLGRARPRP